MSPLLDDLTLPFVVWLLIAGVALTIIVSAVWEERRIKQDRQRRLAEFKKRKYQAKIAPLSAKQLQATQKENDNA